MREIVLFPDKVLRKKCLEIKEVDEVLLGEIRDLAEVLEKSENGAGLAAPQIGISKKFLGIKNKDGVKIYLNPRIKVYFGEKIYPKILNEEEKESDFLEGCLSFPDLFGTVKRYLKIEVVWEEIVEIGNPPKTKVLRRASKILEGFEAIVWQHESDHLEGILFVDRIKEEGGKFYLWTEDKKVLMDVDEILTKEK
jgi:peptide deformylase